MRDKGAVDRPAHGRKAASVRVFVRRLSPFRLARILRHSKAGDPYSMEMQVLS